MSRRIAFAGIFTGVAVVLLYAAAIMPTGKLTLYFLASLPVAFTIVEFGAGTGIAAYFSVCLLSALALGKVFGVLPFVLFFGHYPIFKYFIEKIRKPAMEILLKLTAFNFSGLLWYLLFKTTVFSMIPARFTGNGLIPLVLIAALQVLFFIYDYVFSRLLFYYETRMGIIRKN